jgi:molybdopterin-guanine dinucleotide biosynthesis protein A
MGSDKALLSRGAQTQLSHAVQLLQQFVIEVFVSVRPDQKDEAERSRFRCIEDRYENMGPVAGILAAMDTRPDRAWLVLACDLPNVDAATLAALTGRRAEHRPFTAFRSSYDELPEPLCAIFEPGARPIIDRFVAEGIVCPRKMLIRSDTHLLDQPDRHALDNINTPDDLRRSDLRAAP